MVSPLLSPDELALQFLEAARDLGLRSVSYSRADVRIEAEFFEPAPPVPPPVPEPKKLTVEEQRAAELELDLASAEERR